MLQIRNESAKQSHNLLFTCRPGKRTDHKQRRGSTAVTQIGGTDKHTKVEIDMLACKLGREREGEVERLNLLGDYYS